MKAAFFLFIKAFTSFSIPFGVFMILFDIIEGNPNLLTGVAKGAIYGFLMSVTLVGTHIFNIWKKKLGPINADTLKVAHKKIVITNLPKMDLIDRLIDDPEWNTYDIQTSENEIRIKTKASIWSWGEKIKIQVQHAVDDRYKYEITSVPDMSSTMVDYGRNLQNVQRLEKLIMS